MNFVKLFFLSVTSTSALAHTHLLFEQIAQENLKTVPLIYNESENSIDLPFSETLLKEFDRQSNPSLHEKRRTIFTMFGAHQQHAPAPILDKSSWQDLNILCGPRSNLSTYVASKIDRTHTQLGKAMLFYTLTHPIDNIESLEDKQAIVKELIDNSLLYLELDLLLQELVSAENILPSLFQHDLFKDLAHQHAIRMPGLSAFCTKLNKQSIPVEINERIHQLRNMTITVFTTGGAVVLPAAAIALIMNYPHLADSIYNFGHQRLGMSPTASFFSFMGFATGVVYWAFPHTISQAASYLTSGFNYSVWAYDAFDNMKADFIFLWCVQTKLMQLARFVDTIKIVDDLVEHNKILSERWPASHAFHHFLYEETAYDNDLRLLIELLSSNTFKGTASLFSRAGTILAAFRLLHTVPKFIEPLMTLGELDVYRATAQLYKESMKTNNRWSFARYHSATRPFVQLQRFWNPLIDPERAVANDISLGTDDAPPAMIITGPNAGGKSTIGVKGLTLNLILAQTLGIVPARECNLTPFCKIMAYLNITDDIAAGNSHFKACVLRAQEIMSTMQKLKPDEFGFVALDELFNGTSYEEGQAAAYSFIELLGKQPQILLTTATHFPLITQLEKQYPLSFKNYKVTVIYDSSHKICYPFTLEPGISNQKIAFDLLRQEGFSDEFILRAQELQ